MRKRAKVKKSTTRKPTWAKAARVRKMMRKTEKEMVGEMRNEEKIGLSSAQMIRIVSFLLACLFYAKYRTGTRA